MQVIGSTKPKGEVKAKDASCVLGVIWVLTRPAQPRRLASNLLVRSSQSTRAGTRKMVNYAWPG